MKGAATWWLGWTRYIAGQRLDFFAVSGMGSRNGREQCLGIWVRGFAVNIFGRPDLNNAPKIHHRHAVTDVLHDRKIMGYEYVGHAEFFLKLYQKVDDLRLNRNVQSGNGLIGHNQLWI